MPAPSAENSVLSTNSLWQDTASDRIKRALILDELPSGDNQAIETDVAVIGAGVSGLSAAGTIARAGADVVLLESAAHAAAGASGKNAGIVCMGANLLRSELDDSSFDWLWTETTELALELYAASRSTDAIIDARMVGSVTLAVNEHDAQSLIDEVAMRKQLGLPAEILAKDDVRRLTHERVDLARVEQALWLPQEGAVHPWSLCAHLATQARNAGAKMFGNTAVTEFVETTAYGGKAKWLLQLQNGTKVVARSLVRCVGPTVEPNRRIYAIAFAIALPDSFPVFQDASPFTYYDHRFGKGHLVCTGGPYANAGDESGDAAHLRTMAERVRDWIPSLTNVEPKYTWAVDLKVTPEMVPNIQLFGETVPAASVEGLGALGVLPGILLGRKAALDMLSRISG